MVSWTTVLLIGGTAIAVGAIATYTKAGEGLKQVAGGLAEFIAAPIREGARAVGEIGLGVQQLGGGVGGAFAGIRQEFQAWIDMINKWQGVRPPYIEPGGCITIPRDEPCPTDQEYERVNGQCCWGKSLEDKRRGARGLPPAPVVPIPPRPPVVPIPPRPPVVPIPPRPPEVRPPVVVPPYRPPYGYF